MFSLLLLLWPRSIEQLKIYSRSSNNEAMEEPPRGLGKRRLLELVVKLSISWLDSPFILLFLCSPVTRTSAQWYFTLQLEALEGAS